MNDIAISVKNLSKKYRLYDSPQHRLKEALHPFRKKYHREFWALKDISFEVKKGEVVCIIGQNGSGKSTLLQLISGISQPTEGEIKVDGKISALLELGTGFNPEFTGRQNVYMNGAIAGFSKEAIDDKFEKIASFADIGEFIDQPVKIYSSGMYARLAFSVSVHVDPDILIIDEILSVGDIRFKIKCMDRLMQLRQRGTAMLFVSHSNAGFGDWGLLLEKGREIRRGGLVDVWSFYNKRMLEGSKTPIFSGADQQVQAVPTSGSSDEEVKLNDNSTQVEVHHVNRLSTSDEESYQAYRNNMQYKESQEFMDRVSNLRFGTGDVKVVNTELLDQMDNKVTVALLGQHLRYRIHIRADKDTPFLAVGFIIRDVNGLNIIGNVSWAEKVPLVDLHAGDRIVIEFGFDVNLLGGQYTVSPGCSYRTVLMPGELALFDHIPNCDVFEVAPFKKEYYTLYYVPMEIVARIERASGKPSSVSDYEGFVEQYVQKLQAFE
jgi:lipopolysaccharide transport system ATP-binding protein